MYKGRGKAAENLCTAQSFLHALGILKRREMKTRAPDFYIAMRI